MYLVLSAVVFVLMVAALVDIIRSDDSVVRHLPKLVWLIIVIIMPFLGSVLWFLLGRERSVRMPQASAPTPSRQQAPARRVPTTEEQIAALDREITEWEQMERIRHLEKQLEAREEDRDTDEGRTDSR